MSRRTRLLGPALTALLMGTLAATSASAVPPRGDTKPILPKGATDISGTAKGKQLIADASERFAAEGAPARELRAVKDGAGTLVVPSDTRFDSYTITLEDGSQVEALAPLTSVDPALQAGEGSGEVVALAAASWALVGNACFSRFDDGWAFLDHCYKKYKLSSDGSTTRDYFAIRHYGTANRISPWVLDEAKIRAYRSGSSSQTWVDWSPKSDWSGGACSNTTIGISTPIGGISDGFSRCPELIDFTKSANGTQPDYSQRWFGLGTRGNRELNFEISVSVAQGGLAVWALPAEVHGSPS